MNKFTLTLTLTLVFLNINQVQAKSLGAGLTDNNKISDEYELKRSDWNTYISSKRGDELTFRIHENIHKRFGDVEEKNRDLQQRLLYLEEMLMPEETDSKATLTLLRCAGTQEIQWDHCTYRVGGEGPKGGIVFRVDADGYHGLEVTSTDIAITKFGCTGVDLGNNIKDYIGAGLSNTEIIHDMNCPDLMNAVDVAKAHKVYGNENWFLPSQAELNLVYHSLHADGNGIGNFTDVHYWTSSLDITDNSNNHAYAVYFGDGKTANKHRDSTYAVRLIRKF